MYHRNVQHLVQRTEADNCFDGEFMKEIWFLHWPGLPRKVEKSITFS